MLTCNTQLILFFLDALHTKKEVWIVPEVLISALLNLLSFKSASEQLGHRAFRIVKPY